MAANPNYDPTEFQEVLRAWMDRHGLSQMAAAQTIGMSQGVLNRWLKPKDDPYLVQPDIRSLERLQPYLRVPLIELKRMTGRLSPADLGLLEQVKAGPRDNQLEAFLADIREQWHVLKSEEPPIVLQQAEEVTRTAFRLQRHQASRRRPKAPKDAEDSGTSESFTIDRVTPVAA